jgi:hypothetical protein
MSPMSFEFATLRHEEGAGLEAERGRTRLYDVRVRVRVRAYSVLPPLYLTVAYMLPGTP